MEKKSPSTNHRPKVLIGITGSVAAIKGPELAVRLATELNANVRILLTNGGANFWTKSKAYNEKMWNKMTDLCQKEGHPARKSDDDRDGGSISIYSPTSEWENWQQLGDPVLHIALRDWADILVICPLSAHSLAKLANGFCDDTLSCVARAWDFGNGNRRGKPLILAPAMNTAMWDHPLTRTHLRTICDFWNSKRDPRNGIRIVSPICKTLACKEVGNGALANLDDIIIQLEEALGC